MLHEEEPTSITIARQLHLHSHLLTDNERQRIKKMNQVNKDGLDSAEMMVPHYEIKPDFKKKSFIMGMAFSNKHQILAATGSDGRLFFWISKEKSFMLRPLFIIDASELTVQQKIWYVEKHDVWLTVGKDNVLREWNINSEAALQHAIDEKRSKVSIKGNTTVNARK